jgi:hypothetical protein
VSIRQSCLEFGVGYVLIRVLDMVSKDDPRLPFQEAMDLVKVPFKPVPQGPLQRFMATRAAYLPGSDLSPEQLPRLHKAAFGGHVYAQAGLAVCRAWRELEDRKGAKASERLDLHVCCEGTPVFQPCPGSNTLIRRNLDNTRLFHRQGDI